MLNFPKTAPNSVLIKGEEGDASNMGVSYDVKLHVADNSEDFKGAKKASVSMGIRKVSPLSNRFMGNGKFYKGENFWHFFTFHFFKFLTGMDKFLSPRRDSYLFWWKWFEKQKQRTALYITVL